jgi:hypothetical protein
MYLVTFQYVSFFTTLDAMAPTRLSQNTLQYSGMTPTSSVSTSAHTLKSQQQNTGPLSLDSSQNVVEHVHFCKQMELKVLSYIVMSAWDKLEFTKPESVYERWKLVLVLIAEDNGDD